jgi:YD repeat-containing protein
MVAIVSGNSLGLNLTSLATLGQQGVFGTPTQGNNADRVYVNAATGNLVLQSEDDHLLARGPDAVALRTYNSQGLLNDDNGDNWSSGVWLQPLVLTGALNAAGSSLQRTDRDGSVGAYAFDAAAGLYRSADGEGAYDTLTFVAADNQIEWRDGSTGATQRYQADGTFRLLSASDAAGNASTYTYNAAGRLNSVTTASGDTTFYDYSGNNLVQIRTVSSSGAGNTDIRYAYDASNRLSVVTVDLTPEDNAVADGKVFTTTYTYVGATTKVARIAYSDGSSLTFTYVSTTNKVASVADGLGQVTTFTYGTRTLTVRDPTDLSTTYDVDTAGRLARVTLPTVTVTQPFLNSYSAATNFTYNAAGDLLSVKDGQGRTTSYEYDANGNQVLQRDALGDTITRTFDSRNQLLTETTYAVPDPDGAGTSQPAQPLTRRYVYDAGGRNLLRFAVSAEGRVTEYRYDGFGQQTALLVYAATRYPVGGLAIATPLTEADLAAWAAAQPPGGIQRQDMVYDPRGALQSRTSYASLDATGAGILDGTQSRELFVYDQNGRLLQSVSPGGSTNTFSYDGLGRIVGNTDALGQTTFTSYGDAVAKDVITLANGLVTSNTYDAAGRLASVAQANGAAVVLGETRYWYSTAGRLRMTQDPTGARTWIIPDADGRKAADIDANGTMTEYRYDGNGTVWNGNRIAGADEPAAV